MQFKNNTQLQQAPVDQKFRHDVLTGLSKEHKAIPCQYLYDSNGSKLFEVICEMPEYYHTRTEVKLLKEQSQLFAHWIGPKANIIEFGAGNLQKIAFLLKGLQQPQSYLAIDISEEFLQEALNRLSQEFPQVKMQGLAVDFTQPFKLPEFIMQQEEGKRIIFFPGSTISNFTTLAANKFFKVMRSHLRAGDAVLIGADTVKDPAIITAAYNDAAGITTAFTKNLLVRINRELGGDFDIEQFDHLAVYNEQFNRIESYLVSKVAQCVTVCDQQFYFYPQERVHTEYSYKFTPESFANLLHGSGLSIREVWYDKAKWFSFYYLAAE